MNRLLLLGIFLLSSCKDCTRYTKAYIYDYNKTIPLAGVKITSYAALNDRARDERVTYTDSTGAFEAAFKLSGVAKCGNLKLIITHPGYETAYENDLPAGDTLYLRSLKP